MTVTPREAACIRLLALGLSHKDIAAHLGIRPATVKAHLLHARVRNQCRTTLALVVQAMEGCTVRRRSDRPWDAHTGSRINDREMVRSGLSGSPYNA